MYKSRIAVFGFSVLILIMIMLGVSMLTYSALTASKTAQGSIEFSAIIMYSANADGTTCTLTQVLGGGGITDITIPARVKLNGNIATEQDLDGTASGTGWLTVTGIDDSVFENNTSLQSVSNSGTLTNIGASAFSGCTSLNTLNIDFTKIQLIGDNALANTPYYQTLYNNTTDAVVKNDVFFGYKSAKSGAITLDSYRVIAGGALKGQTGVTTIKMPSSVSYISENIVQGCTNLVDVDLTSANITFVKENAFLTTNDYPVIIRVPYDNTTIEEQLKGEKKYDESGNEDFSQYNITSLDVNETFSLESYNGVTFTIKSNVQLFDKNGEGTMRYLYNKSFSAKPNSSSSQYIYQEKYLLCSDFSPYISLYFYGTTDTPKYYTQWVESIACFYYDNDNSVVNFSTATQSYSGGAKTYTYHSVPLEITYSPSVIKKGYDNILNYSMSCGEYACFTADSKIQLADGTYKLAKDIEYDDLLLCYNFDEGRFAESYPVWITKSQISASYYLIEFYDGTEIKIIESHRIYSVDDNYFSQSIDIMYSQVGHNMLKLATDENGNALVDKNGNFYHTTAKVKKISMVQEEVQVINIVTAYQLNHYINGILGSTGFSNMYSFEEEDENLNIKYNQEELSARRNGEGTMYTLEDFEGSLIDKHIFQGWRVAELKGVRTIQAIIDYLDGDYGDLLYAKPTDAEGNYIYKLSTSDGYSAWIKEGERYTLPTPNSVNDKTFKGWYNNADGKYYQAGDTVEIYVGTHFTAFWV